MIGKNADTIQMNTDTIKQYHNTNSMITKMSTEDTDMLNLNQVDIALDNPELWIEYSKQKIRQLLRQTGN